MNGQTTKPHWILRTHEGVPVPPSWASMYEIAIRFGEVSGVMPITHMHGWSWRFFGDSADIVAIRWIK